MNIAAQILDISVQKDIMISCAESCTGGMVAAALTDLPGSSAMMDRGFVTYTNAAKIEMLDVSPDTLNTHGAVSREVAEEMANGALAHSNAALTVSITGIAGPGGSEHKPEGRVCFAVASDFGCHSELKDFGALGRDKVRIVARDHALDLLLQHIQGLPAN